MHTGTHPEMKDQISHITKKTEVKIQHNDKPCSLGGELLKKEK